MTNFNETKAKVLEHKEKAADLDNLVRIFDTLSHEQLKSVLPEEALTILVKYGYTE